MKAELHEIQEQAIASLKRAETSPQLEEWRLRYIGKSGQLRALSKRIVEVPPEQRPDVGRQVNQVQRLLEASFESRKEAVERARIRASLVSQGLDVTLPGRPARRGRLHIATQTLRRVCAIWADMGFQIYRSPDVETDEMNFQLLNFPAHHPAREMQDSFHTTQPDVLLRTHTSPGQIRAMREYCPDPIRVVLPGMCYRYEQITARSEIQFNQVEGLAVGKGIRMSDLKGTLTAFARRMFGPSTRTRFRCSHFPFTEPSAEMDIECFICQGRGCRVCKHSGWLEILGCGMVHPVVLRNGGYDPALYSGFAFGMGPERISMLRHDIRDIRNFWSNDLRFLEQF